MKKLLLSGVLCLSAFMLPAQKNMYVWVNNMPTEYSIWEVDSITFADASSIVLPEGVLPGVFSVSKNKQVHFSKGNLQYQSSTGTWCFADNQYDYLGIANVTGGSPVAFDDINGFGKRGDTLADKIDLFGWGTGSNPAQTSTEPADYSSFVDWGENTITNGGNENDIWRTLTYREWQYLLEVRPEAADKKGVATVAGIPGLILLPDNWQSPDGIVFKSGFANENSMTAYGGYQSFTASEWQQLECAGAVFLPASGVRSETSVFSVGNTGGYWTATATLNTLTDAGDLVIGSAEVGLFSGGSRRWSGQAVRLVMPAR